MSKTNKKKVILFVCSGNTCRSQIFALIAQAILGDEYICKSAGTVILSTSTEENGKKAVDKILGIDSNYPKRTTEISQELIDEADVVFCLGENIKNAVLSKLTNVEGKLMSDNMPDPYDLQYFPQEIVKKLMQSKGMDFEELRRDKCQEAYDIAASIMKCYAEENLKDKIDKIIENQSPSDAPSKHSGHILGQAPQYKGKL